MKKSLIILAIAIIWHLLIWEAGIGLNMLIFSLLISVAVRWIKPEAWARKEVKQLLIGWCLSAVFVVWHHSALSIFVFILFGFVSIGYLQQTQVRFWFLGLVESLRALLGGWLISLRAAAESTTPENRFLPSWRKLRLLFLPILVLIPFYLIYSGANSALAAFNEQVSQWFSTIFQIEFDWSRFWVFLLGWALMLAYLGRRIGVVSLHKWVAHWTFSLERKRKVAAWPVKPLALKQEYQSALLTFGALNLLLGIINSLDLATVWFSYQERTAAELSKYVHEGTWLLIFSIILAMLVVLFFLRSNLNFFPKSKLLRQLVFAWLAQNVFLAFSVGVRNGRYIEHYGLAHGRILVIFFLALVLFGLYTMYQKVKGPKTLFYLLQTNAGAMMIVLLLASSINWDSFITRYNLQQEAPDTYHMVQLLDNNLIPLLEAKQQSNMTADRLDQETIRLRGQQLVRHWESSDWRSWNWSKYRQYKAWKKYESQL